jgi:hypothetical protein
VVPITTSDQVAPPLTPAASTATLQIATLGMEWTMSAPGRTDQFVMSFGATLSPDCQVAQIKWQASMEKRWNYRFLWRQPALSFSLSRRHSALCSKGSVVDSRGKIRRRSIRSVLRRFKGSKDRSHGAGTCCVTRCFHRLKVGLLSGSDCNSRPNSLLAGARGGSSSTSRGATLMEQQLHVADG